MADGAARAVFIGFLVGYAAAILFTGAAAVLLVRLRSQVRFIQMVISPILSPLSVAILISILTFLLWTAAGMALGLLFYFLEDASPRSGLGSPNLIYTIIVLATGLLPGAPWLVAFPGSRRYLGSGLVVYFAIFAWTMPHLIA